jgi:hypothetical protein
VAHHLPDGRRHAHHLRRRAAPLPGGLAIPGLQDWLLSINLSWAQELTIIMFVWMAKFGAAYGVRTGIHVGVDVLINRLNEKVRAKFIIFGCCRRAVHRHRGHHGRPFRVGERRALRLFSLFGCRWRT